MSFVARTSRSSTCRAALKGEVGSESRRRRLIVSKRQCELARSLACHARHRYATKHSQASQYRWATQMTIGRLRIVREGHMLRARHGRKPIVAAPLRQSGRGLRPELISGGARRWSLSVAGRQTRHGGLETKNVSGKIDAHECRTRERQGASRRGDCAIADCTIRRDTCLHDHLPGCSCKVVRKRRCSRPGVATARHSGPCRWSPCRWVAGVRRITRHH